MCAYKLVTIKFKWWGLQNKVENFIQKVSAALLGVVGWGGQAGGSVAPALGEAEPVQWETATPELLTATLIRAFPMEQLQSLQQAFAT